MIETRFMSKYFLHLLFFAFLLLSVSNTKAQTGCHAFTSNFVVHSVTYNGSDDPNECWESVAWGILIEDGKNTYFFSMPYQELMALKEKIGDAEVIIDIRFYQEPDAQTGEDGGVKKITMNGEVLFGAE